MVTVNGHPDGQQVSTNNMLAWYMISLRLLQRNQSRTQQARNFSGLPESTRPDQDQSSQNHEQTCSREIEEIGERPRDHLVITIKDKLEQAHKAEDRSRWGKLCIYKVPHYLNEKDNKSYHPQTVSLGPYHHGEEHLRSMESHKWRAVNRVLKRSKPRIEVYIDAMRDLEVKARACYEGPIKWNSDEFIEMLVLDGCFVLELLMGTLEGFPEIGYARNDPVFAMRGLMHSIQRDMVMLENQLPLFVLNRLLDIQLGRENKTGMVAHLAIQFFNPLMPTGVALTKPDHQKLINWFGEAADSPDDKGELHCLDVFRQSLLRSSPTPNPIILQKILSPRRWSWKTGAADKRQQQLIHCVTELREAGIKFKRRKTDRFWDIRFKKGYLEIPKLLIHDGLYSNLLYGFRKDISVRFTDRIMFIVGTKSLFSNLIAFEQCHIDSGNNMTSYIIFMDNLINSSEDVSYLHHCGIVEHWLGSDSEVADLFNRLCREVVFNRSDSYLSHLSDKVNQYYSRKRNVWRAALKHKYFNNPWAIVSFCAAVILLILTFSQSFYAVFAYYKPNS